MDFLSSVDREHDIVHFPVAEFHDLVIEEHAVRRQREAKMFRCGGLLRLLLEGMPVSDQLLHDFPVHERLPAEKVDLKVPSQTGILHKEIKRLLPRLQRHESPSPVVFSFLRKAVSAGEITVVGDMQTERFDDRRPLRKLLYGRSVGLRREKRTLAFQFLRLRKDFIDVTGGIFRSPLVPSSEDLPDLIAALPFPHELDGIIEKVVGDVHRARRHIENNIETVTFILVNLHILLLSHNLYF